MVEKVLRIDKSRELLDNWSQGSDLGDQMKDEFLGKHMFMNEILDCLNTINACYIEYNGAKINFDNCQKSNMF